MKLPEYRDWIRGLSCSVCLKPSLPEEKNQPHHVRTKGATGSDRWLVPICPSCHSLFHSEGRSTFDRRIGFRLVELSNALWDFYWLVVRRENPPG